MCHHIIASPISFTLLLHCFFKMVIPLAFVPLYRQPVLLGMNISEAILYFKGRYNQAHRDFNFFNLLFIISFYNSFFPLQSHFPLGDYSFTFASLAKSSMTVLPFFLFSDKHNLILNSAAVGIESQLTCTLPVCRVPAQQYSVLHSYAWTMDITKNWQPNFKTILYCIYSNITHIFSP